MYCVAIASRSIFHLKSRSSTLMSRLTAVNIKTFPNKQLLQSLRVLGYILTTTGPLLAIGLSIWWFNTAYLHPSYYPSDHQEIEFTPSYFWIAAILFSTGMILIFWPGTIFKKYYRTVNKGRVVYKDTSGGGIYGVDWYIVIEGKTLAGEIRRSTHYVSAGYWQVVKIGSIIDFDD